MAKKKKNKAAVALGSLGGKARARNLSTSERSAIARQAATARWGQRKESEPVAVSVEKRKKRRS